MVFRREDHVRLRDALGGIQGKWLLSYNDCAYIRELYEGYRIETVKRLNNLAQRYNQGRSMRRCSYQTMIQHVGAGNCRNRWNCRMYTDFIRKEGGACG